MDEPEQPLDLSNSRNPGLVQDYQQDEPMDLSANGPYRSTVRSTQRSPQANTGQRPRQRQASPSPSSPSSSPSSTLHRNRNGARKRANQAEQGQGGASSAKAAKINNPPSRPSTPDLREDPAFKVVQDARIKRWKSGVEEKTFRVQFDESKAGERLIDVRDQLVAMFDTVVQEAGRNYSRQDKARMTIFHDSLQSELFVHLQNLENLTGESIMNRFERVLNSHEEMVVDSSFQISVGLLRMKKGGGGPSGQRCNARLPLMPHLNNTRHSAVVNKKSIVEVVCSDGEEICAAKAVTILVAKKTEKMRRVTFNSFVKKSRQCTRGRKGLRARALALLAKCGLPNDRGLTIPELASMESVVNAKILVITHSGAGPQIIQCSTGRKYEDEFFLYLTDDHYHAVVNPDAMFCSGTICRTCYEVYKHSERKHHPCRKASVKCFACGRVGCEILGRVECQDCNVTFRSIECYNVHLNIAKRGRKSLCERRKKCANCEKVVYESEQKLQDHVCGTYKCNHCAKWVDSRHLCYLRRKQMQKSSGRFLFFDFESVSDSIFQCRESYAPKIPNGCGARNEGSHDEGSHDEGSHGDGEGSHGDGEGSHGEGEGSHGEGEGEGEGEGSHCGGSQADGGGSQADGDGGGGLCHEGSLCKSCRLCKNCKKSHCGRNQHQPNLVVAESCCDSCKDDVLKSDSVCLKCGDRCDMCVASPQKADECQKVGCGRRRVVFKGMDTVFEFCAWLFTPKHKNFTVLAHYGKGYDFMFLLNWLVMEAGILPDCIFSGSKIMSLEVKEGLSIKCIDSLNFMMMSLKKLPKAFGLTPEQAGLESCEGGLEGLAKLDFPHAFNTRDRWDYEGPYPPLEMYGLEFKSEVEREKLKEWHDNQQGKIFNLQRELEHYCTIDTTILRLACMTFRRLIMDITTRESDDGSVTYVDCFSHVTMASCVMQIFRLNHIEEVHDVTLVDGRAGTAVYKGGEWTLSGGDRVSSGDILEKKFVSSSIAQLPSWGYVRTSNHSAKSIQWLEYESKVLGREIIHARNHGEHEVRCGPHRYHVDGFDPQPVSGCPKGTVWEFLGCVFHGHSCIDDRKKTRDPRTRFTLQELNRQTLDRLGKIKSLGYAVKTIYECEFDKLVKQDNDLKQFIERELDVPVRMNTRMAFFGGRTSGFKLHCKIDESSGEEIHYLDVCSLYPFVNKHKRLPLGHPRIVTTNFDMSLKSYFGIAHAKVLAPQNDYLGVLPYRARGKLHFPLCRTCCESAQQTQCEHTEEQRALTGVWCTPELQEAVRSGYTILKVYEIYQYDNSSEYDPETRKGGLFAEQVDLFLKLKAEASGFPQWAQTPEARVKFVERFEQKTGVTLDIDKIEVNPALRSICKLGLNCFWGKLGQRSNMSRSVYIRSTAELDRMVCDSTVEVSNFHIINEDVLLLEYKRAEHFEEESGITNDVLAAFTTCHARLELLKHIRTVKAENILYADTDSIIFKTRKRVGGDGSVQYENYPETGDSLGELTNELPEDVHIVEFCCSAPKSYAFRSSDGKESCKFKGVTLHSKNSQRINFEAVKELVYGGKSSISLEPETQFHRCKLNGVITNVPLVKKIKHTFDKRRVLENLDTVPYGYKS